VQRSVPAAGPLEGTGVMLGSTRPTTERSGWPHTLSGALSGGKPSARKIATITEYQRDGCNGYGAVAMIYSDRC
jgi:hypothetical protein